MSTNVCQLEEERQEQEGQSSMEGGGDGDVDEPLALQKDWPSSSEDGSNGEDNDGEGDAEEVEALNPLMMEDALEVILDYLSFAKLKEVRSVHPLWNKVATRLMTPRCQPINFNGRIGNFGLGFADMKRLNELITTSSGFPCKEVRIFIGLLHKHGNLNKDPNYQQEIVVSFFRLLSPFVQQLEINYFFGDGVLLFPEGLPPSNEFHFPELTSLLFDLGDGQIDGDSETRDVHKRFLINVVEHAPKLSDVRSPRVTSSRKEDQYVDEVLRHIPERNRRQLQKLVLRGNISDQDLHKWLNHHVRRLRELELVLCDADQPSVSEEALAHFLKVQSETLETLTVEYTVREHPFILQLPKCLRLKSLHIAPVVWVQWDFLWIDFLSYSFPVLEKLVLNLHLDAFFNENVTAMETVKELELQSSLNNPTMVAEMARVLPNLRKLILWVRPDSLGAKDLEPLKSVRELVLGSTFLSMATSCEEFLTGCSKHDIEWARWLGGASTRALKILAWWNEPLPFLKGLKSLTISGELLGTQAAFSDVSCRFALLKLPGLTYLDLSNSKFKWNLPSSISSQVMVEMQSKFIVRVKPDTKYCHLGGSR